MQLQQVWTDPPARRQGFAGQGASRPDPAAARADADRLPLRAGRERARDPALRVGRHAPRARLPLRASVNDALPRAPRALDASTQRTSSTASRPGRGSRRRASRRRARSGASSPSSRSSSASARVCGARRRRSRSRSPAATSRSSSSRCSTRSGSARSRAARWPTYRAWAWAARAGEPTARAAARRASTAAARIADGLDGAAAAAREAILAVSHGLPVRYVLDAADGRFPGSGSRPCRTRRRSGSSGRPSSGRPRRSGRGRRRPASRIPRLADDGLSARGRCILSA